MRSGLTRAACPLATVLAAGVLALSAPRMAEALTAADVAATAPHAEQGLRSVLKRLAGRALLGRDNNTPESVRAQGYLVKKLRHLGEGPVAGASGDAAYRQPFVQSGQIGTNLVAVIRGRELPEEYVMVGGHYDHLGTRSNASGACGRSIMPGGAICPGATDNAAGAAVVLSIGRALRRLPEPPRRSVLLVLWDAEEKFLAGSLHYVRDPVVPLAKTVAYLNFDIQGANLLPSLRRTSFAVGAETGGSALGAFTADAVAAEGLETLPVSYIFGQLRSDYANLVDAGVPTVFFGDSSGPCYHSTGDVFEIVDFAKLRLQSRIGFRLAAALAETDVPPAFRPPSPALATFVDAVSISRVFAHAVPADLVLFAPDDQLLLSQLAADTAAVVAAGPAAFDGAAVGTVLTAAVNGIGALERIPCQRF